MKTKSKFQIYQSGKVYRFRLLSKNGRKILVGEAYTTKQNCLKGVKSVQENSLDDNCFEKKRSSNGKYYFVLKATNGEIIGASQMYSTVSGRNAGIRFVKTNASISLIEDFTRSLRSG